MAPRRRPAKRSVAPKRTDAKVTRKVSATGEVAAEAGPIALVLIDDNRLLREGIVAMVSSQPGFKVLAASADAAEALNKVR
jgi:hypothetical protein